MTESLVETGWLADHLHDPNLRVLDATVFLTYTTGDDGRRRTSRESGAANWASGHIPGSIHADLVTDLSDTSNPLPFMMPPADQFAAAMSRLGVGDDTFVVTYDSSIGMWATRLWWMLRAFGHDNAAVLNGGWKKWTLEGRTVVTDLPAIASAVFTPRPRPRLIADKAEVRAAIDDGAVCILNALSEEQHRGTSTSAYGRAGHIPGALNVSAGSLLDPDTGAFLPIAQLRERFRDIPTDKRIITYCGGGIAATADAFALTLLGAQDVAVYDGSMTEWGADPAMPLEVG